MHHPARGWVRWPGVAATVVRCPAVVGAAQGARIAPFLLSACAVFIRARRAMAEATAPQERGITGPAPERYRTPPPVPVPVLADRMPIVSAHAAPVPPWRHLRTA